jgi:Fe-S oxidoreductase
MRRSINPDGKDALYFSGCTELNFFPDTTRRIFSALRKFLPSIEFIKTKHHCCGFPLMNMGLLDEFMDNARELTMYLNKFKLVLTNCPACAFIIGSVYRHSGINLKVNCLTVVEFFEKISEKINVESGDFTALYHDPCYLARYKRITREPRELLRKMGCNIKEFSWHGIDTECCGASLSSLFPDLADGIARKRLGMAPEDSGDNIPLVTSCPSCRKKFASVSNRVTMDVADEFAKRII